MNMKRLVALRPLRYQRRDLVAGDAFDAPTVDASYLMRTGRAEPFSEEEHAPLAPAAMTPPATFKRGPGRPSKSPSAVADDLAEGKS